MSMWQKTPKTAPCHNPNQNWIGLSVQPDRAWLHERIARRLELMWQADFVGEVVELLQKYPTLTPDMPSMRCVGYRQVVEFLAMSEHDVMNISPIWQDFAENLHKNTPILTSNGTNPQKIRQNIRDLACQDMKNKALYATRQLAKRQATWQRSLARLNVPTITNIHQDFAHSPIMVSFDCIKEVEKHLLSCA